MSLTAAVVPTAPAAQPNPHPTIRAMAGAGTLDHLDPKTTALVVIDFQNEYSTGKMPIPDGAKAAANAKKLIAFADKNKMPVFQVQHVTPAGSAVFAIDGDSVQFQPGMEPRATDIVVKKDTVSVFASSDIDRQLKARGIKTLVIAGLMTHACVAGAARDAAPLGYGVVVASDASATRDITRANGHAIDKDSLHRAALAEVEDTFGDVMTTSEITHLPLR
ncbi:cysteine hydrolase family protein [Ralstonia soli]|uniref:Isochorismatase family protein n=1 Tax=Ralstonia soli TaxID=2953896 RepID=A0ABT1AH89_9RALS|nr:isochorismatase family protein [Ralstonia soli]MCO5397557.1 isochorismatase family protein [Ralstonia soli]